MNRVANLFLLVVLRIVAVFATQEQRTRPARVTKFPVRTFSPAGNKKETRPLQVADELADFARHTREGA